MCFLSSSLKENMLWKLNSRCTLKLCLHAVSRLKDVVLLFSQYEVKAPMPSACFRNVCKQMAKMHEAISELLPEEQTQVRHNTPASPSVIKEVYCPEMWFIQGRPLGETLYWSALISASIYGVNVFVYVKGNTKCR